MSTTSIKAFKLKGTSAGIIAQYHNSYGSAPVIWDYLFKKYVVTPASPIYHSWSNDSDALWALDKDPRLEEWEKDCLLLTYDYLILKKKYVPRIAASLKKMYEVTYNPEKVNHLLKIAETLESSRYSAFGFQWTSSSGDLWYRYNLKTKDKHWFLFEEEDPY